jgi:hypothetical protein
MSIPDIIINAQEKILNSNDSIQWLKEVMGDRAVVSIIIVPLYNETIENLTGEIDNFFLMEYNDTKYTTFSKYNGKEKFIHVHVHCKFFQLEFKRKWSAKFPGCTLNDAISLPNEFKLKVANIPDCFFYDVSRLKTLGQMINNENYLRFKTIDYNGAYTNQVFMMYNQCPLEAMVLENGFYNPGGVLRRPLKILWNYKITCDHCDCLGHSSNFCPLETWQEVKLWNMEFIAKLETHTWTLDLKVEIQKMKRKNKNLIEKRLIWFKNYQLTILKTLLKKQINHLRKIIQIILIWILLKHKKMLNQLIIQKWKLKRVKITSLRRKLIKKLILRKILILANHLSRLNLKMFYVNPHVLINMVEFIMINARGLVSNTRSWVEWVGERKVDFCIFVESHFNCDEDIHRSWGNYYLTSFGNKGRRNGIFVWCRNRRVYTRMEIIYENNGEILIFDIKMKIKTQRFICLYLNPSFKER